MGTLPTTFKRSAFVEQYVGGSGNVYQFCKALTTGKLYQREYVITEDTADWAPWKEITTSTEKIISEVQTGFPKFNEIIATTELNFTDYDLQHFSNLSVEFYTNTQNASDEGHSLVLKLPLADSDTIVKKIGSSAPDGTDGWGQRVMYDLSDTMKAKTNLVSSDTITVMNETSQTKLNLAADVLADVNNSLKLPVSAPSSTELVGVTSGNAQVGLSIGKGFKFTNNTIQAGIKKIYTSGVVTYDGNSTEIGSFSKTLVDTTNNIYVAAVALKSTSEGGQSNYMYNYNVILQPNNFGGGTAGQLIGTLYTYRDAYDDEIGNTTGYTTYSTYVAINPVSVNYNVRVATNQPNTSLGGFSQVEVTIYEVPLLH